MARRSLRRLTSVALIGAGLTLGAGAAPASAACTVRWQPGLFDAPGSMVPVCDAGPQEARGKAAPAPKRKARAAKPKRATTAQRRKLRYTAAPAVSAATTERLIARLAGDGDPQIARDAVESNRLLPQFQGNLQTLRWSTTDLGDAYAVSLIGIWLMANGRDRMPSAIGAAVREHVRNGLALDRRIRQASDAARQERAEWLGAWTTILVGAWNSQREAGDPAAAEAWRKQAVAFAATPDLLGLDVTTVKLTKKGVERR